VRPLLRRRRDAEAGERADDNFAAVVSFEFHRFPKAETSARLDLSNNDGRGWPRGADSEAGLALMDGS
jgi:hypothetical protein